MTRGRANSLRLAITGQLGAGCVRLRRDGGDAEALRLLQGLPARMPDRRRHGAHEDRGAGRARGEVRAVAARPAGRLSAALCAVCGADAVAAELARHDAGRRRSCRRRWPALQARRRLPRWRSDWFRDPAEANGAVAGGRKREAERRGRVLRRHVQPLFRAGEYRGGAARCSPPPATVCIWRSRSPAAARSAAAARSSRSGWSRKRGARPSARSRRSPPMLARGIDVVGLEPSCLFGFRDEIPALLRSEPARAARRACVHLRGIRPRAIERRRFDPPLAAGRRARAAARPLPSEILRHHGGGGGDACGSCRGLRSRPWSRAAAAWRARSATAPTPSMSRSRWPSCRCCRRCAPPPPIRWWWRPVRHAGIRSRTAAGREPLHVARVLAMSVEAGAMDGVTAAKAAARAGRSR